MKHGRTVKYLIPHENIVSGKFLTVLLLVLSVVLCLGSASLIAGSIGFAADDNSNNNMIYSGTDGKTEVIYSLSFVDPSSLSSAPIEELFVLDNSLYLSGNPVLLSGNNADNSNKYVNILGGYGNTGNSDFITIIGGLENVVNSGNDSSSVLGGESNELFGNSNGAPAVIAGGIKNNITNNKGGDVIIGGSGNGIKDSQNSFILGGEGNEVDGGDNVIVGGKNVKVRGVNNIFVFSNSEADFGPESSNAFYLNLDNGVGINVDSENKGLSVGGAVGLGSIGNATCNEENLGVEGSLNGCLVGCTEASKRDSKWELFDRGEKCKIECERSEECLNRSTNQVNYEGFCENDDVSTQNATQCGGYGAEKDRSNVVFKTILVDTCPDVEYSYNKCIFKCIEGFKVSSDGTRCVEILN